MGHDDNHNNTRFNKRSHDDHDNITNNNNKRTKVRDESTRIAEHYNKHQQQDVKSRQLSKIISLRSFNNWVKSLIIQKYTKGMEPYTCSVLDLCCGKGGDLNKFSKAQIG